MWKLFQKIWNPLWSHLSRLKRLIRIGSRGERAALRHLRAKGYTIWETNWRCHLGELDIIAIKEHTLVCVEVKTRRRAIAHIYPPIQSVDLKKQMRIDRLIKEFTRQHATQLKQKRVRGVRFDVVGVLYRDRWFPGFEVMHYKGAF